MEQLKKRTRVLWRRQDANGRALSSNAIVKSHRGSRVEIMVELSTGGFKDIVVDRSEVEDVASDAEYPLN